MHVHPSIAALRADRTIQTRAQAAMIAACDEWRKDGQVAPVLADLENYGSGAALAACPNLASLFEARGRAEGFAAQVAATFSGVLASEPFGQLAFRHSLDAASSSLLLARSGLAQLSLVAREPGEYDCSIAHFSDAARHELVLAGQGEALLVERRPDGGLGTLSVPLGPGSVLALDLAQKCHSVSRVERRLVSLRLIRGEAEPKPSAEYDIATGDLVGRSAGEIGQSRRDLMLALLGRMERTDAAPVLAEIAREKGPDISRWEALRECLALDTATGFGALVAIARDANDPLCAHAGALRAQLIEAHPELAAWEKNQCPA